jgi:hypothetical protein
VDAGAFVRSLASSSFAAAASFYLSPAPQPSPGGRRERFLVDLLRRGPAHLRLAQGLSSLSGPLMAERELIGKDKLVLRGLQFHGFHGVKQEEKTLGQKFAVDVDAWMDLSIAGETDSIYDTVSYTDIYR